MAKVTFNEDLCKGCSLCVSVCPKNILQLAPGRLNSKGHQPAEIIDQDACIACTFCGMICPDNVITIEK